MAEFHSLALLVSTFQLRVKVLISQHLKETSFPSTTFTVSYLEETYPIGVFEDWAVN